MKVSTLPTFLLSTILSVVGGAAVSPAGNNTRSGTDFRVWWHDSGEINTETRVKSENVRQ